MHKPILALDAVSVSGGVSLLLASFFLAASQYASCSNGPDGAAELIKAAVFGFLAIALIVTAIVIKCGMLRNASMKVVRLSLSCCLALPVLMVLLSTMIATVFEAPFCALGAYFVHEPSCFSCSCYADVEHCGG